MTVLSELRATIVRDRWSQVLPFDDFLLDVDSFGIDGLRDDVPSAYKNIGRIMRAQRELTRIVRELRPALVYKG